MSEFKNMKFRVSSEESSKEIQNLLFEMGYKWPTACREVCNLTKPFLYTDTDGYITYGVFEDCFLQSKDKEFKIERTLHLVPKETKTITIAGKNYDEELVKYWLEGNSVPCIEEEDE